MLGSQTKRNTDIAKLKVDVDDDRPVSGLGERNREVAGSERLAGPSLGADDADHRRELCRPRRPAASRNSLLERKGKCFAALRQRHEVVHAR